MIIRDRIRLIATHLQGARRKRRAPSLLERMSLGAMPRGHPQNSATARGLRRAALHRLAPRPRSFRAERVAAQQIHRAARKPISEHPAAPSPWRRNARLRREIPLQNGQPSFRRNAAPLLGNDPLFQRNFIPLPRIRACFSGNFARLQRIAARFQRNFVSGHLPSSVTTLLAPVLLCWRRILPWWGRPFLSFRPSEARG